MDLKELVKPDLYAYCLAFLPILQSAYNVFDPDDGRVSKKAFGGYLAITLGLGMLMAWSYARVTTGDSITFGPTEVWQLQGLACWGVFVAGNRILKLVYSTNLKTKPVKSYLSLDPTNRGGTSG